MKTRTKLLIWLVLLALLDTIIPLPLAAGLLIYVLFERPNWFEELVSEIYSSRKKR